MIVFIDVLVFINIIVNFFVMYITAKTMRVVIEFKYMILSSAIGGMYVVTMIFPRLEVFSTLPFKICAAAVMIVIAFRRKNFMFNIKALAMFIMYSMLLAGVCMFIQYNRYGYGSYDFSSKWLLIAIMMTYVAVDRLVVFVNGRRSLSTLIYNVDIVMEGGSKSVKAFLDTGNELKEPATNLPVIIVERSEFLDVNIEGYDKLYIPYRVVNGSCDKLLGFKPKSVIIKTQNTTESREAVVAFCDDRLSEFSDYHALLPRGVI